MRRDEEFRIDGRGRLEVNLPSGSVQVRTGTPGVIQVSIDGSDPSQFDVTCMGDLVSIVLPSRGLLRGRGARVVVQTPPGCDVDVRTASADVEMRGELGAARVRTASGDVDVEQVSRLDAQTASGDVRVGGCAGDASFNTASGDVVAGRIGGRLAGSLASGDLRAASVVGAVDVGTASGDVNVGRCDGDEVAIKTVSGDIKLGLPTGIRVDPEISTLSGRTILPEPARTDASLPRRPVRVRLRSVSGDIRIDRAG